MTSHEDELERIRDAYRERDAARVGAAQSGWGSPAYAFYMQRLEWDLLRTAAREGIELAGARVLEVGCGSGYYLQRFAEYGAERAVGIDLMEHRIAEAQERYPTLELVAGDAGRLPWPDGTFNVVSQFTCLSSVLDADLRRSIAAEMWRVLEPGGSILSYDMRPIPAPIRLAVRMRSRGGSAAAATAPSTETTPIGVDELSRLFPGGDIRHRPVSLSFDLGSLANRGRWIAEAAAALPLLRTHLMAVVRKPAT